MKEAETLAVINQSWEILLILSASSVPMLLCFDLDSAHTRSLCISVNATAKLPTSFDNLSDISATEKFQPPCKPVD